MSPQPQLSALCRLVHDALRPLSEEEEKEKQLLVALSQLSHQIKLLSIHHSHASDYSHAETTAKPCVHSSPSHSDNHHCLARIIAQLVSLLGTESLYVQHLAGNVLVVISEFVPVSGKYWDEYIHLLCLCLEFSICKILPSVEELPDRPKDLYSCSPTSVEALKLSLKTINWSNVAGIIWVLRKILKHLKIECDDQLLELYLSSIRTCLSNIPWDFLDEVLGQKSLRNSGGDSSIYTSTEQVNSRFLLNGNFVQFFSSLVAQDASSEAASGHFDEQTVTCEISNVLPKVLAWCFGQQGKCHSSLYFRHKILMLMIRLSYRIHMEYAVLVSWLNIIHKYFEDLLSAPLTKLASDRGDCLEGSPFLMSSNIGKKGFSSRHLQRLAVFLFLRCSLSLIRISERDGTEQQCLCAKMNSHLIFDKDWGPECCSRKQGFLELYKWLQKHLPSDIFLDSDTYSERCKGFALAFLQLFMHEDDILFKVLLQLFCSPFSEQLGCKGDGTSQEVKRDMVFLVSSLLNPICLFHLYLAELHYDHHVLLDYLISKDTGASSAEYLLRCLRTVCDSWEHFTKFSFGKEYVNQAQPKKRKVVADTLQGSIFCTQHEGLSLQKGSKRRHKCGRNKRHVIQRLPFEDAIECLISLKKSMVNLHKKKLFPYNPDVLLRRLSRFEEMCLKQKNIFE